VSQGSEHDRDVRLAKPVDITKATAWYHIAAMNNWREVVDEQTKLAGQSGLKTLYSGFLGTRQQAKDCIAIAGANGVDLDILFREDDFRLYETPTLAALQRHAHRNPGTAVMYFHTKGVSAPSDKAKIAWRQLGTLYMVGWWNENLRRLCDGLDGIGINWQDCPVDQHFQGNMWLARTDWINLLPDMGEYSRSLAGETFWSNPWERMCAEVWFASRPGYKIESLGGRNEQWSELPAVLAALRKINI